MTLRLLPLDEQPRTGSTADLLAGLNTQQQLAVSTTEGPLLIIAGAGSGKTKVLTVRIAHILQSGVHPSHVMALTFTNKAAQEMKERISHLVGGGVAKGIWAGTFHSLFARILRQYAEKIGYTNSFTIYDTDDQTAAIKAVMNQLGISQQVLAPSAVRSRISSAKNAQIPWQIFARDADNINDKQTGLIYEEYEKRLRQSNAMDFDDLLVNTIRLLENNPEVLATLQERFRYLLVDEYQDTNKVQYRVVSMLANKYKNLCVVGDDAQSIYRWRGADIQNILDFERDYPAATVVRLEQNYRSTQVILAAADSVIKRNSKQLKKTLWTDNEEGDKITLLACRDDREEADSVVKTILSRMRELRLHYSDVAVLYRTNAQSQALEDAFRRHNVAYNIVSGVSFYKRKEVKDTISYLRLLVNPADSEGLLRVINEPARGIGNTSLERIQEYAAQQNISLFSALQLVAMIPNLQKRIIVAVEEFIGNIVRYQELATTLPPATVAQQYIEATGLLQMYKTQDTDDAQDRWNNIGRVLSHLAEQQEADESLTLTSYLEQIALLSDTDDPQLGSNRISMMTMHAAKGLEFPLVVIAGMEQGLFPLAKAEMDPTEQEEERRLFYVGITRARRVLVLSYAERRYRFGELVFSKPSMFLSEIDKECLAPSSRSFGTAQQAKPSFSEAERKSGFTPGKGTSAWSQLPQSESYSQVPPSSQPKPPAQPPSRSSRIPMAPSYGVPAPGANRQQASQEATFANGTRVRHPMFGEGEVVFSSGSGQMEKATVVFANGARKQLVVAFARLERL